MDLLACPAKDCRSSLNLEVFSSHMIKSEEEEVEEIDEALITCPQCNRWYPVIDGIACMLPDDNRKGDEVQKKYETAFLERWKTRISANILKEGIPFGLDA